MEEKSRIKFNPQSREFEIEGSEAFVKKYFVKIQEMISSVPLESNAKTALRTPGRRRGRPAKDTPSRKESNVSTILNLIYGSKKGMSTTELETKSGLTDRQIWGVIYRAEKAGKIKKTARGVYTAT
ncbi:MAG: hypothetical protein PHY31_02840 [Smithellaceae bacterium]|nr:hypothetical protein [Smithellaceae bacterium]